MEPAGVRGALFSTFWHGGELAPWHWACLSSFIERGHQVRLFSYRPVRVPPGVDVADAATVLPERDLFTFNGSVSAFSNVFRYELLWRDGGWWVDTDVYCLTETLPECRYAWADESPEFINGAILKFPTGDPVLEKILASARAIGRAVEVQGQLGPRLLTAHLKGLALDGHFGRRSTFYPLHWLEAHRFWTPHDDPFVLERCREASFVHLWDMMFKYMGLDARVAPPTGSFLERIVRRAGYPAPLPALDASEQDGALDRIRDYLGRAENRALSWQQLGCDVAEEPIPSRAARPRAVSARRDRPRLTAIIAARNEADVIGHVARDLAAQGADIYLIDDGSTDETVAEVERHAGARLIGVDRLPPSTTYQWARLLERKEELADELDSDWFVHADADEFRESPWPGIGFVEAIGVVDALGWNAIDFALLNFWATHDDFRPGDDVRAAFVRFAPGEAFNTRQVRCWKKTATRVSLAATGGHDVRFAGRRVFPTRFLLRHYPIRGQAHGARKVFADRVPRFDPGERARRWHVQYDDVRPGTSFLRDPATLSPYDPLLVRAVLNLRPRTLDELEATRTDALAQVHALAREQGAHARAQGELAQARDALAIKDAELRGERDVLARSRAEVERLEELLASETARLGAEVERLKEQLASETARLGAEVEHLTERVASEAARAGAFESRLGELYGSISWRLTRPLRGALHVVFLGRSPEPRRQ